VAEAYPAVMNLLRCCYRIPKDQRDKALVAEHKANFDTIVIGHLTRVLADNRDYYLGFEFSAADICFGYVLMVAVACDADLLENLVVVAYNDRLAARESYKELFP
jgi:glutathione S-transferase